MINQRSFLILIILCTLTLFTLFIAISIVDLNPPPLVKVSNLPNEDDSIWFQLSDTSTGMESQIPLISDNLPGFVQQSTLNKYNKIKKNETELISPSLIYHFQTLNGLLSIPLSTSSMIYNECFELYDLGYLQKWRDSIRKYCTGEGSLICYQNNHPLLPSPTLPHSFCQITDLFLDISKIHPSPCLSYRPNYMCDHQHPTYYRYEKGALSSNCILSSSFSLSYFSRDILRDVMSSFIPGISIPYSEKKGYTLLVTRERGEHVNLFHGISDIFNAFLVLKIIQIPVEDLSVILMDNHGPSFLDQLWELGFSHRYPLTRIKDYPNSIISFDNAILALPGYSSLFFGELDKYITNEEEIIEYLTNLPNVVVNKIDFSQISLIQQIQKTSQSDIIMGMHGAGLTHLIWLPPHGVVLEIRPKGVKGWYSFKHLSEWSGLTYFLYINQDQSRESRDTKGDYLNINIVDPEFQSIVKKLITISRQRRNEYIQS